MSKDKDTFLKKKSHCKCDASLKLRQSYNYVLGLWGWSTDDGGAWELGEGNGDLLQRCSREREKGVIIKRIMGPKWLKLGFYFCRETPRLLRGLLLPLPSFALSLSAFLSLCVCLSLSSYFSHVNSASHAPLCFFCTYVLPRFSPYTCLAFNSFNIWWRVVSPFQLPPTPMSCLPTPF